MHCQLEPWMMEMATVFLELHRVLKPGGHMVVEIGGLRPKKVRWDEVIGSRCQFEEVLVLTKPLTALGSALRE